MASAGRIPSFQGGRRQLSCVAALFLLLVIIAPIAALAQTFPPLTGRVVDAAGILEPEERAALEAKLKVHEDRTANQVVIASVPSLEDISIEDYANRLFRTWQLGQQKKNNGVLLLIAPKEREVRIEVGYGLEGTLTDALAGLVITKVMMPQFRQNRFAHGIDEGVNAILEVLTGETGSWRQTAERHVDSSAYIVLEDGRIRPVLREDAGTVPVTEQDGFHPVQPGFLFGLDSFFLIFFAIITYCILVFLVVMFGPKRWQLQSSGGSIASGSSQSSSSNTESSYSGGGGSSGGGGASGRW
jgi:uncharacterized protein